MIHMLLYDLIISPRSISLLETRQLPEERWRTFYLFSREFNGDGFVYKVNRILCFTWRNKKFLYFRLCSYNYSKRVPFIFIHGSNFFVSSLFWFYYSPTSTIFFSHFVQTLVQLKLRTFLDNLMVLPRALSFSRCESEKNKTLVFFPV